ncbi:hypothetical protein DBV15_00755 [Temnothorax longispinosus]|uniref:Uncharacterized protein n=1 Tax=Temnothorax longispinosus TaxID=300112 RepID=A0A4V3SB12_9HYME|nr:hypothetical protein DBV15_00755 [Temnothorax longispinosus]
MFPRFNPNVPRDRGEGARGLLGASTLGGRSPSAGTLTALWTGVILNGAGAGADAGVRSAGAGRRWPMSLIAFSRCAQFALYGTPFSSFARLPPRRPRREESGKEENDSSPQSCTLCVKRTRHRVLFCVNGTEWLVHRRLNIVRVPWKVSPREMSTPVKKVPIHLQPLASSLLFGGGGGEKSVVIFICARRRTGEMVMD